jgi:vanillate/3-O-methylgallate O-demethylase
LSTTSAGSKSAPAKHAIACDENGLIAGHGVLQKAAENDYRLFVSGHWLPYHYSLTKLDVQQEIQNNYLYQVAGPTSRQVLEAAAGESIEDIGFLRFREVTIAGHRCELMRIGMAGTLAYELHGPIDHSDDVYNAVLRAGAPHGIKQLGWKTYYVNHVEGGFPQQIWTFLPAIYDKPDFLKFAATAPTYRVGPAKPLICGSVDPSDMRARYRTPLEVGGGRSVVFERDYIGREALEREMANAKRTIVTLEWNSEDVIDIYASHFRPGEEYKYIEAPVTPHHMGIIGHADHVLRDGGPVGISSGVVYSYYFRKVLSHCTLDLEHAEVGTELVIQWGEHGSRIKEVRAKVAPYPYLSENRNQVA